MGYRQFAVKSKQQFAVAGAAVALAVVLVVTVVVVSQARGSRFHRSFPIAVFQPAPRFCPRSIGLLSNGTREIFGRGHIVDSMAGHVPGWLPTGFGLSDAFGGPEGDYSRFVGPRVTSQAWTDWSDGRCRSVTVSYYQGWKAKPAWHLEYDKANQCGNYVMGMGRCIGYTAGVRDGVVSVQTIGLSDAEAAQVIRSIRL